MYGATVPNPAGFAGPNDHWHSHIGVCGKPRAGGGGETLGSDGHISKAECEALGFVYTETTLTMLHVWTAPSYASSEGAFSHENRSLTCKDGTYFVNMDWADMRYLTNRCRSQ